MISGTFFKHHCRYRIGDYTNERHFQPLFKEDKSIDNNFVFIKTELIDFFARILKNNRDLIPMRYSLVLHNSDINFDISIVRNIFNHFTDIDFLYTQNLLCTHPFAYPLPIGLPNPKWSHGNLDRIKKVINQPINKTNDVYVDFNISTNQNERLYCLSEIGHNAQTKYPNSANISEHNMFVNETHEVYLQNIKSSYFTVSPDGNGKDCHKTWEALYMGSIPIVTDSYFARKFKEYGIPLLIINDWSEYKTLQLDEDTYNTIWNNFDISQLNNIGFWFRHD